MNIELVKTIAFEFSTILVSTIASFLIPGLTGILISGLIQLTGDLGIELYGGGLPSDPTFYLTEFMAVFGPFFAEIKSAKLDSALLRSISKVTGKIEETLQKVDDALINAVEYLKLLPSKQFANRASGLTQDLEAEVKVVEQQEIAREKFGEKVKITKRIESITPNTKNPDSWIASVGFLEKSRLGPRDIRGDLIISYYVNNEKRVGFRLKKIGSNVLGRTSAVNKKNYSKVNIKKDMSIVKIRKVVFSGARYYNDYLAFLKSHSWGGYYMRRWMIGTPGRKPGINGLILFGDIYRVWSKFKSTGADIKDIFADPKNLAIAKSNEFFGQTRFGSKYNQYKDYFSKANQYKTNPFSSGTDLFKSKGEQFRDKIREKGIK